MDKKQKVNIYLIKHKELNDILNKWDFLSVVDEYNQDEYTDLIEPILKALEEGKDLTGIAKTIVNVVSERYELVPKGTYEAANEIVKWWNRD